jgi:PIN domain nuclease of toxin-antitoxin system
MQRLLLDTHAFLWWLADEPQLSVDALKAIADQRNDVFVSAVSGWEIAIKRAAGKLQAPENLDAMVEDSGFTHLPITFFHGEQAGALPMRHRDPFGRMLIAQAQAEGLVIVTNDPKIRQYGVRTLAAS